MNISLVAPEIRYILEHNRAVALLVDGSLLDLATQALQSRTTPPDRRGRRRERTWARKSGFASGTPTAVLPQGALTLPLLT
jgi:hypothetical protein